MSHQFVSKGSNELEGVARAVRQSGAQALLVAGHFDEAVNMRKVLKRVDWQPQAYYAAVGPALDRYGEVLGTEADGTLSSSEWEPRDDLRWPGSVAFVSEFTRTYGEKPSYHAANAYAAGVIFERAIQKAGRVNRAGLRDALSQLDTVVLTGRYTVDRTGMSARRFPLLIQWQQGRREIVWPNDARTAPPKLN